MRIIASLFPFDKNRGEFHFLSWNGRGLCVADSVERNRLRDTIRKLSKQMHVLCFQEVHGRVAEIILAFQGWLPGWHISVSVPFTDDGMEASSAGGVVTAVCPHISGCGSFEDVVLVPGRCLGTSIFVGDKVLHVLNIHNHDLRAHQVRHIGNYMSQIAQDIKVAPCSKFGILIGDLNIKAEEELVFKVGRAVDRPNARSSGNPVYSGSNLRIWESILSEWTEVWQPYPTHFHSRDNSCSRIDRGWIFCPSSLLTRIQKSSYVVCSPEAFHAEGLSDHAPLVISFAECQKADKNKSSSPSIPVHICRKPELKMHVESLIDD
jgi:hypothetical protein